MKQDAQLLQRPHSRAR